MRGRWPRAARSSVVRALWQCSDRRGTEARVGVVGTEEDRSLTVGAVNLQVPVRGLRRTGRPHLELEVAARRAVLGDLALEDVLDPQRERQAREVVDEEPFEI